MAGGKSEISSFPFSDPPTLRAIKRPDGPSLGGWLEEDGAQAQVMLSLTRLKPPFDEITAAIPI